MHTLIPLPLATFLPLPEGAPRQLTNLDLDAANWAVHDSSGEKLKLVTAYDVDAGTITAFATDKQGHMVFSADSEHLAQCLIVGKDFKIERVQ